MVWRHLKWRNGGLAFRKFPRRSVARWPMRSPASPHVLTDHPEAAVVVAEPVVADAGVAVLPARPEADC
jgi:hypothetical protein